MNTTLSKKATIFYLLVLTAAASLWVIVIGVYIFVQLYIYPIETIVATIAIKMLYYLKIYLLFKMLGNLPKLENVLDDL